jgi:hypothetical protein
MTALPPALDRFGAQLENAARHDLGARRKRRWILRVAALSAIAAAVAFGILSALPTGGRSVVERAAAALEPRDDTILHYQLTGKQRNPDGSVVTWHSETWQLRVAPFTRRQIEVGSDGIRAESLTRGDLNELYDARTNTIYAATRQELVAAQMPKITVVSKSELAKITRDPRATDAYLVYKKGGKRPTVLATKEGARRLREKMARAGSRPTGVVPEEFRGEILALLRSGRVRETGRVEVAGREAIRFESPDGKRIYLVDAATYAPIQWTTSGQGGGVTLRFPIYDELAVDTESLKLLDLEAQHPEARVVRDTAAYRAAEERLFPHG